MDGSVGVIAYLLYLWQVGMDHKDLEKCVKNSFVSEAGPLAIETPDRADYSGGMCMCLYARICVCVCVCVRIN